MNHPSSAHLSHDFEVYMGLTLRELLLIVCLSTLSGYVFLSLLGFMVGFPLALGVVGFLLGFILGLALFPKLVAPLKKDKPHGYLKKAFLLKVVSLRFTKSPYLSHEGQWRKGLNLRKPHV